MYARFTVAAFAAAVGGYDPLFNTPMMDSQPSPIIYPIFFFLFNFGPAVFLLLLIMTPYSDRNQIQRLSFFELFAFFTGGNLFPIISMAHPTLVSSLPDIIIIKEAGYFTHLLYRLTRDREPILLYKNAIWSCLTCLSENHLAFAR